MQQGTPPYTLRIWLSRNGQQLQVRDISVGARSTWSGVYTGFSHRCIAGSDYRSNVKLIVAGALDPGPNSSSNYPACGR